MKPREALLSAAGQLLWERGYESMSPKEILRESGIGQGSMYHHFTGKRDLAIQALEEHERVLWSRSAELLDRRGLAAVTAWLSAEREVLAGCRLGRLANEQSFRSDAELGAPLSRYFERLHALLSERLTEAQRDDELPAQLKPDELASMIIAVVQGGYVLALATQDPAHMARATSAARALLESSDGRPIRSTAGTQEHSTHDTKRR